MSLASLNRPRVALGGVLALVTIAFLPSLGGGFIADDFAYIARFRELPWSELPGLFTRDWSGGIWGQPLRELRPMVALSFMSDARLFGGDPTGYRVTNLALHLIATWLVMRLAWLYAGGAVRPGEPETPRLAAMLGAGLVFGLHPAHAEAVSWITGRVDVQATAAALLFVFAAERFSASGRRPMVAVAGASLLVGLYSKELCLFAPLLLLLRWVAFDLHAGRAVWLRRLALFAGIAVVIAIYHACRRAAFGHDSIGYNIWTDAPAWERQAHYAGWLWPIRPFFRQAEWQGLPSTGVLHAIWLVIAVTSLAGFALARWRGALALAAFFFFGGIWYLVTVFPLTGVVYFSPRHLYFPSVGLALAAGFLVLLLRWRPLLVAGLFALFGAAHISALRPWLRAADVSASTLALLDRELAADRPGTVLVTSVPETLGPTLLWAWSSPACVSPPFVSHRAAQIVERPANYIRSDRWDHDRQPVATVRAAPSLVALHVDGDGRATVRRVEGTELAAAAEALAQLVGTPRWNPDAWSEWVRTVAVRK